MAYDQHQHDAAELIARCAVVTLSDTRNEASDTSGGRIRALLTDAGHVVTRYAVIPDDPARLSTLLDELMAGTDIDVILTTGGTGISRRDNTIAVVESKLTLPLPGFGELFRMLSWEQIGSGAMLSRATGGAVYDKLLFAMPGSTKACELAMTKLILPELKHLMQQMQK